MTNIDTIREALEYAKIVYIRATLANAPCKLYDDALAALSTIEDERIIWQASVERLQKLLAESTVDPDELARVKLERNNYKLWWEGATETHNQLRKLYDEQNTKLWAILKRPECPEGIAQRLLKMPEADRDYFLSLAVESAAHDDAIRRELLKQICPNYAHQGNACPGGCECKNSAELVAILGTKPAREEL